MRRLVSIDFHSLKLHSVGWWCEKTRLNWFSGFTEKASATDECDCNWWIFECVWILYSGHSIQFSQGIKAHSVVCFCLWPCIRLPAVAIPFLTPRSLQHLNWISTEKMYFNCFLCELFFLSEFIFGAQRCFYLFVHEIMNISGHSLKILQHVL